MSDGVNLDLFGPGVRPEETHSIFSLPANYSEKNSTFSKKAFAPPDVPLVFI